MSEPIVAGVQVFFLQCSAVGLLSSSYSVVTTKVRYDRSRTGDDFEGSHLFSFLNSFP